MFDIPTILFLVIALFAAITTAIIVSVANKESRLTGVDRETFISSFFTKKKDYIDKYEIPFSIKTYTTLLIALPIITAAIFFLGTKSITLSVLFAALTTFIPELILKFLKSREDKAFDERYARSLFQLSSCLRAGMTIHEAVTDTANCSFINPKIKSKYKQMDADLKVGIDTASAFQKFADSVDSQDAQDVASAIKIQEQVGGHEDEVVNNIANNIQQRIMIKKEIKTLFTTSTMLIYIMDVFPIIVFAFLFLFVGGYKDIYLSSPMMILILIGIVALLLIGSVISHRILKKAQKGL